METKNSNNFRQAKCAWCGGSGSWSIAWGNHTSCVVCAGKGQVTVTERASQCQQCQGSGKSNSVSPCLTCAGTGWENVSGQ